MLKIVNKQLEKFMPLIAPISVVIGVLLANQLVQYAAIVPWIFAFMTFTGSLNSNFRSLKDAIVHPFPIFIALFVLHIFMPLWAVSIGHLAFSGDMFTITGLILAMVIPTGITSFIWVSIYKGNAALTLSIILIDTILSPLIVPFSLSLLVGESVQMDSWNIMRGLVGMVVIPSIIGMCLNQFTKGRVKKVLAPQLAPFSKIGLSMVIMINCSVVSPYLININAKLVWIAIVVLFIAFCGYFFAWMIGRILRRDKEIIIALTFTGGMRNISAGAVIAVAYFPAAVALPVVIGLLFQQVLASIYGKLLNKHYEKSHQQKGFQSTG